MSARQAPVGTHESVPLMASRRGREDSTWRNAKHALLALGLGALLAVAGARASFGAHPASALSALGEGQGATASQASAAPGRMAGYELSLSFYSPRPPFSRLVAPRRF